MKRYLMIILFITYAVFRIFSDNVIIFPTVTIGFSNEEYINLSKTIETEIKNKGYEVVEYGIIEDVLGKNNYSIQQVEYSKEISNSIGKGLNADSIYFNTLIWNGEYFTVDFHRVDVNEESYWHKIYSFKVEVVESEEFSKYGIAYIVNDSFISEKNIKNIFLNISNINDNEEYINTIAWMRKNKIANLYLSYGAISGFEKFQYQLFKNIGSNKIKYDLYESIKKVVLQDKELIEKSGEYVKVIHLGSYNRIIGYVYNENSLEIGYPYIQTILENPINGVKFYGTKEESLAIESLLNRDQRNRYWLGYYWE